MNRVILLLLHLVSLVFFCFGLVADILKIDITASFIIDFNLFNEKRSVLGTLQTLWESSNYLPFFLILLFGIIIPLVKSGIVFYILLNKHVSHKWLELVGLMGKWAMADVFAISILIAFLGANAMKHTTASFEPGFYYFTIYVLMSATIGHFLKTRPKIAPSSNI